MSTASRNRYYSGFNPLMIGGCSLWLDAADESTITLSGSSVTQWNDKSRNSNNATQGTAARRPTYANNAVTFVSANQNFLSLPNGTFFTSPTTASSIFLVMTPTSTNTLNVYLFQGVVSTNLAIGMYLDGTRFVDYWQTVGSSTWSSYTVGRTYVYSYIFSSNSTNISSFVDGSGGSLRGQPNYSVSLTNATLGAEVERSFYSDMTIREVLVYRGVEVNASQREQIEGYLAWKWGLRTNLLTTHSYYSIAPVARPFLPLDIPNLHAWYDAADRDSVILSGSNVTTWLDKSGRGFNLSQTTVAWRPTYSSANNEIVFDGSVSYFVNAALTVSYNLHTLIAVHNPVDSCGSRVFSFQAAGLDSINFPITAGTSMRGYSNSANTTLTTLRDHSQPNEYNIIVANIRSGSQSVFNNGMIQSTSNLALTGGNSPRLVVGGWVQVDVPTQPYNGKIREILIYSSNLSLGQQQQVEGYLARKWGLANPTGSTSFLPTSLAGCQLWIDAADATTITVSGSDITGVRDKSSNAISVSVSPTRPTYTTTPNTNLPAINFGGSSWLRGNFPSTYTGSNFTVFAVASMNSSTPSAGRLVSFGNGGLDTAANSTAPLTRAGTTLSIRALRGPNNQAQTTIFAFSTVYLLACEFTGASNFLYYSGMPIPNPAVSTGPFNFSRWGLGYLADYGGTTATNYWNGVLCECIVYFGSLSSNDRWQVNNYLVHKWRLFDFPLEHPMKTMLPATASFNPRQISNCILWLDASDPTTITLSGANVTQWSDKSGTANHAVRSSRFGFLGPTVTSSNTLRFTRVAGTTLQMLRTQTGRQTTSEVTCIVVAKPSDDSASGSFIDLRKTTNGIVRVGMATNTAVFTGTENFGYPVQPFLYSTTNFSILTVQARTNLTAAYANGTLAGGQTAALTIPAPDAAYTTIGAFTDLDYGAGATGVNQINFTQSSEICEVVMYNSFLSLTQIQQLEGYLAWKWGLRGFTQTIGLFNPTQIPGCQLWLDAADPSTLTLSGSSVTSWADKSGNGRNATGGVSPTFLNNGVNFNGSQRLLTSYSAAPTAETICIVATINTVSSGTYFMVGNNTGTTGLRGYSLMLTSGLYLINWHRWGTASYASTSGVQNGVRFLTTGVFSGSSGSTGINGGGRTTGSFSFAGTGTTVIGAVSTGTGTGWPGTINEIIIYGSSITLSEREQVEGYLANKWGLLGSLATTHTYGNRGLPVTHPYKTISPI